MVLNLDTIDSKGVRKKMAVVGWQIYGKSDFLMCNSTLNVQSENVVQF